MFGCCDPVLLQLLDCTLNFIVLSRTLPSAENHHLLFSLSCAPNAYRSLMGQHFHE